jgi:hypothetical protein
VQRGSGCEDDGEAEADPGKRAVMLQIDDLEENQQVVFYPRDDIVPQMQSAAHRPVPVGTDVLTAAASEPDETNTPPPSPPHAPIVHGEA